MPSYPEVRPVTPYQAGPVGLAPAIVIRNAGYDSNILYLPGEGRARGDVTATFSPAVDASLWLPRIRVTGRAQVDVYYFREFEELNGFDNESSFRLDVPLNRVRPYVAASLLNTRYRQNLELDDLAERKDDSIRAGAEVRVTSKVGLDFYAARLRYEYMATDNVELRGLNHKGTARGLVFRYAVTPLTTFAVGVEHQEDRFEASLLRDSTSLRIEPGVEFKPFALVNGRAVVGYRKHTSTAPGFREFKGTVASVDLNYAFHERTQFSVGVRRDLEYSYLFRDAVVGGAIVSVTHRLGDAWDISANIGRYRSNYRGAGVQLPEVVETTVGTGTSLGYNIGRKARVAADFNYSTRLSGVSEGRSYDRLQIASSLRYTF